MGSEDYIKAVDLSFTYSRPTVQALEALTFSIAEAEFVAVMGPNGSGKTTLLMLMLGLLVPGSGDLRILGYRPWESRNLVQREMGYVPQREHVNERLPLSARDVVMQGVGARQGRMLGRDEAENRLGSVLRMIDLVDIADRPFSTLSGGQQQRALIGRALALNPGILLLDEPFAAVDASSQVLIADLLKHLSVERGVTVIVVVHNINPLVHHVDSVMLLNRELIAYGPSEKVLCPEILRKAYGTDVPVVICDEGFRHPLVEDSHGGH